MTIYVGKPEPTRFSGSARVPSHHMSKLFTDDLNELDALHLMARSLGMEKSLHFLSDSYYLLTGWRHERAIELGAVEQYPKEPDNGG